MGLKRFLISLLQRLKVIPMNKEGSRKTHMDGIKTFFDITNFKDLKICLKTTIRLGRHWISQNAQRNHMGCVVQILKRFM